jgi:transposase
MCAQVFVAAIGASSYTFACATVDQSMWSRLDALARALTFYGGCPQLIIPDNPRALVSEACRYESKLDRTEDLQGTTTRLDVFGGYATAMPSKKGSAQMSQPQYCV